jgi:hypothetical protein
MHTPDPPKKRPTWNETILASVARSLTPAERASLEEALGNAATRWEARANPLLDDLEGGDPNAALIAWFKKGPQFLATAQATARWRTCATDGFCVVPRGPGAECPQDTQPPADLKEDDRARFIHWSWGHALRFRAATPDAARAAAEALRDGARTSKTVAVVMLAEDAEVTTHPPYDVIRERWRKVGGLERVAHHEKTAPPTVTIEETPNEIIVLPRHDVMSAADPDAVLTRDVLAMAPALTYSRVTSK